MFCRCPSEFGAEPNTRVCPVCLGLPGALPMINRTAVEYAVRIGLALECAIAPRSVFARKNYFYPDCPKNYQITQYDLPLCADGRLELDDAGYVRIKRIHLEEDAGKLIHTDAGVTTIDMNRCGVPLVEIVTEPDIHTAADAALAAENIRSIVRYLDVCDGNMEEGSLRCDVNVSVRKKGSGGLGVNTEIKNLNSFQSIQRAIEFEIARQAETLADGGEITHATLLWDPEAGRSQVMRSKEEEKEYRYFPEPDLPPLDVSGDLIDTARGALPELPDARRRRFEVDYGLPPYDAALLTGDRALADFYERTASLVADSKTVSNWVMGEVLRELNERKTGIESLDITAERMAGLINAVADGRINAVTGKDVFAEMVETGADAESIVEARGLEQIGDAAVLDGFVKRVLADHPEQVSKYLAGEEKLFKYLLGQVMKASGGKADPAGARERLERALDNRRQG
jgi:aspartyl-tRNA(Asn)/glutamyl-tRNA(Gln) amidotransferase subunit B